MNKLWYQKPAKHWREALPIGNGFTGAMLYGGKKSETICFNDSTLWSGYPKDYNSKESLENLDKVRELIFNGKNDEADKLTEEKLKGFYSEAYMPLGIIKMKFCSTKGKNYRRELDLTKAIHTVKTEGFTREAFASYPDKVTVYHIISQRPFSMSITAKSKLKYAVSTDKAINLYGNAPDYAAPNYVRTELRPLRYNEQKGMAFCLRTEIDTDGIVKYGANKAVISNATRVTLYFATATGFKGYDQMPDTSTQNAIEKCKKLLAGVEKDYEQLKERHIADFAPLFAKQNISLHSESDLPSDELLKAVKKSSDVRALSELLYKYGKYMILTGSRVGGQPLNLQGIWNNSVRPPWSSNYTTNINAQMNYWGAGRANLTECLPPFIEMIWESMQNGKKTAQINYGCNGFACNHNVDIWRKTPPVTGTSNYMFAPLCGAWLSNEIYAHYKNGGLEQYKEKIFEVVKEAAQFCNDFLVLHDGKYVICPSASPENSFDNNGKRCSLDHSSAFDMGIVKQAFANYLEIAEDDELKAQIADKLPSLYPFSKGETGINEWHKYYNAPEKGHRHFSPLYAFYPANQIKYYANKEETAWVDELFKYRIKHWSQYIGWSAAWAICLAGRLHDKKTALKVISGMLAHSVFSNFFCVHPPFYFQIDGNLGFVAGINEMLVYEENNIIDLVPAVPDEWRSGSVDNMWVNGAQITFEWKDGKVTMIESDKPVTVRNINLSENVQLGENVTLYTEE